MRSGLSPAATNRAAAVSAPTPEAANSAGLTWAQRWLIWVVSSVISAVSASYRRAKRRRTCLAYLMVVHLTGTKTGAGFHPGFGGHQLVFDLVGAVTTKACSWMSLNGGPPKASFHPTVAAFGHRSGLSVENRPCRSLGVGGVGLAQPAAQLPGSPLSPRHRPRSDNGPGRRRNCRCPLPTRTTLPCDPNQSPSC